MSSPEWITKIVQSLWRWSAKLELNSYTIDMPNLQGTTAVAARLPRRLKQLHIVVDFSNISATALRDLLLMLENVVNNESGPPQIPVVIFILEHWRAMFNGLFWHLSRGLSSLGVLVVTEVRSGVNPNGRIHYYIGVR